MLQLQKQGTLHSLPVRLKVLTQKFLVAPLTEWCRHRIQRIKFWMGRMAQLKVRKQGHKKDMHLDIRKVLADKTCLLWKEMLLWTWDMVVVEGFVNGRSLVGVGPTAGLWPLNSLLQPCQCKSCMTLQGLRDLKEMDEVLQSVWTQTLHEVDAGFLIGPFELAEILIFL